MVGTLAIVVALGVSTSQALSGPFTAYCRTPGYQSTAALLSVRATLGSTHPVVVALRRTWGLATADTTTVVLSSDEAICQKGSIVMDSLSGVSPTGTPVYVYNVGTSHFVVDRGLMVRTEKRNAELFDSNWTFVAHLLVTNVVY